MGAILDFCTKMKNSNFLALNDLLLKKYMAAILDFCTKMKNSYFLALNDLLDQSQPNQTWWEWPARSVVHIF